MEIEIILLAVLAAWNSIFVSCLVWVFCPSRLKAFYNGLAGTFPAVKSENWEKIAFASIFFLAWLGLFFLPLWIALLLAAAFGVAKVALMDSQIRRKAY